MFIGVDLIKDQAERTPATAEAEDLITRYMGQSWSSSMWEASTQLQTTPATQELLKYNQLAKTETNQPRKALCDSLQAGASKFF